MTHSDDRYPDSFMAMRNKTLSMRQPLIDIEALRAEFAAKNN